MRNDTQHRAPTSPRASRQEAALIRDRPQREGAIKAGFVIGLMHILGCSTNLNVALR